ncbi:MAG TPA: GNAT family N-acetyltransferase [Armatimonadota bacterium]|nr:GNAT family N-acetyltransferase [Armatimonadota bacterium]
MADTMPELLTLQQPLPAHAAIELDPHWSQSLVARRLIVADAGESWLDDLFMAAAREVSDLEPPRQESFIAWLKYKRRSVALAPGSWLAFFLNGHPVGLAQGACVARVFHNHFFYLNPGCRSDPIVANALGRVQEFAARHRCHTILCEGPNTGALARAMEPRRLVAAGFTWHERIQLGVAVSSRPCIVPVIPDIEVAPLSLAPSDVSALIQLESEAFLHAACDHPGEIPTDLSDGYRTTLLPMQATSAVAIDALGLIRGALYGEAKGSAVWIHTLFVEPGWRHRGIARIILEHCLESYRRAGFDRAELSVLAANIPAVHLYLQAGFTEMTRVDLFMKKLS